MALSRIAAYRICKDFETWKDKNRKALVPKDAQKLAPSTLGEEEISVLTPSEQAFARRAIDKGDSVYRSGWPDFLVEMLDKTVAVEVKRDPDRIHPKQRKMFAALERIGVPVLIWNPARPDVLTPWRKYHSKSTPYQPKEVEKKAG
jgi:hypothetical protein